MKVQGLFITIAALLVVSCNKDDSGNNAEPTNNTSTSQNSAGTSTGTSDAASDLDAMVAQLEAEVSNSQGGVAKLDSQAFFDPAWAKGFGQNPPQNLIDEIRRVMFMERWLGLSAQARGLDKWTAAG